ALNRPSGPNRVFLMNPTLNRTVLSPKKILRPLPNGVPKKPMALSSLITQVRLSSGTGLPARSRKPVGLAELRKPTEDGPLSKPVKNGRQAVLAPLNARLKPWFSSHTELKEVLWNGVQGWPL